MEIRAYGNLSSDTGPKDCHAIYRQPRPAHVWTAKNLPEVVRVAQKIRMKNRSANGTVCATVTEMEPGAPARRSARHVVKGVVNAAMSDVLKQ
jgi:hypothetical protein